MFLINTSYIAEPAQVEPYRQAHKEWVAKYVNDGTFLFAGPKKSNLGGVILTKSIEKELLLKILSEDSFVQADVVETQIIDFVSVLAQPEFANLAQY